MVAPWEGIDHTNRPSALGPSRCRYRDVGTMQTPSYDTQRLYSLAPVLGCDQPIPLLAELPLMLEQHSVEMTYLIGRHFPGDTAVRAFSSLQVV